MNKSIFIAFYQNTPTNETTSAMIISTPFRLAYAALGLTLSLALLGAGTAGSARAEEPAPTIKLLSDDAADECIRDQACMHDLFLEAATGGTDGPLLRSTKTSYAASFAGEGASQDLLAAIQGTMKEISLLATTAGAEFDLLASKGDSGERAAEQEVINLMILISDDFARDRERAFAPLLSNVFAGDASMYDSLAASPDPICRAQLFADPSAAVQGALALAASDVERDMLKRCLHRLALNMLGLRHPLPADVDSLLNPTSPRKAWTSIDFLLVKLLHDPRVQPGMTSAQLSAVFPKIYGTLLGSSS